MWSASPLRSTSAARTRQRAAAPPLQRLLRPAFEFLGFWAAVVLPFVLLWLVVSGLATRHPMLAGGLLAGNVVGLRLGRGYKR